MASSGSRSHASRVRVLYCFPKRSTFIDRDVLGLSAEFDVRTHELAASPAWHLPFRLLHQLLWLIRNRAWAHDCICHFSGYHALLPALLCRRTFIILAGSDCASIPSIGYGAHARHMLGWATRSAVKWATRALPVHESLMKRSQTYSNAVPPEQGMLAFAPGLRTPWTTIPYGFDADFWTPGELSDRDPMAFICVPGPTAPMNRLHRLKGVDLVLEVAAKLPSARFIIVGLTDPTTYGSAHANVEFLGRTTALELLQLYRSASFHLQLSLSEGMPNALCEAMLCGCIPLVSDVASMPGIVEGCGSVLKRDDADLAVQACSALLALDAVQRAGRSRGARDRVRERYSSANRLAALTALLRTPS